MITMSTSLKSWGVKTNKLKMAVLYILAAWSYDIRHGLKLKRSVMKANDIEVHSTSAWTMDLHNKKEICKIALAFVFRLCWIKELVQIMIVSHYSYSNFKYLDWKWMMSNSINMLFQNIIRLFMVNKDLVLTTLPLLVEWNDNYSIKSC